MDKIQQNVQTVRLDQPINIVIWNNTGFTCKSRQSPFVKWTPTKFELALNIKTAN